jgi:hypothetical protein
MQIATNTAYTRSMMAEFSELEARVARHYNESVFDAEQVRLLQDSPVEFGVTLRWLGRVAKGGDVVAEISLNEELQWQPWA